jgi:hypothetical protein
MIEIRQRGQVTEIHIDHSARRLAGAIVRTCPQGEELIDLGCVVRLVVHGTQAEPVAPHVPVEER